MLSLFCTLFVKNANLQMRKWAPVRNIWVHPSDCTFGTLYVSLFYSERLPIKELPIKELWDENLASAAAGRTHPESLPRLNRKAMSPRRLIASVHSLFSLSDICFLFINKSCFFASHESVCMVVHFHTRSLLTGLQISSCYKLVNIRRWHTNYKTDCVLWKISISAVAFHD